MSSLFDLLFPPTCPGCGEIEPSGQLCPSCRMAWAEARAACCPVCKRDMDGCLCRILPPEGMELHPRLDAGLDQMHLIRYEKGREQIGASMIYRAKEKTLLSHERFFGKEFGEALCARGAWDTPPLLTYVPRQRKKVRLTGADQARMLARGVGKRLSLPHLPLLLRIGGGEQKKKRAKDRFASVKGSYQLNRRYEASIAGREIWLFDDIITTGASVLACADLLYRAGAARVLVLAIAKTDFTDQKTI